MGSATTTTFGELLKRHRGIAGLTQEALAALSGLSARGISDLERGTNSKPQRETVRLLADALALSGAERTQFEAAALRRIRHDQPARVSTLAPLPQPPNALLGRAADVSAGVRLLRRSDVRLVTLTGPGGVGKTRLSLQIAAEAGDAFADGIALVHLAPLRDPALVLPTIALAAGVQDVGDDLRARLLAHLRPRRMLLVLDNFEHLLAAAPVVAELLAHCPAVKVLATSRAMLRLSGEYEVAVPPLALPTRDERGDLDELARVPTIALFGERVRAFDPAFILTPANAAAVAEICVHLDGLPLAIELAAARCKYLPPPELARRLERRLPLLTHGPRDLPARQQTLRDTIGWSYDLLQPDEQRLLRLLSVFVGGWTLEAAEALCAGDDALSTDVIGILGVLIDANLVRVERRVDQSMRYGMLETIREFADEQLAASGEADVLRGRHATYFLALSIETDDEYQSAWGMARARQRARELDNVRAALQWFLDQSEMESALCLIGTSHWIWYSAGRLREGVMRGGSVLARSAGQQDGWGYAKACFAVGSCALQQGDFAIAHRLLAESVECFEQLPDRRWYGKALQMLAYVDLVQGDIARARARMEESARLLLGTQDRENHAQSLFLLGDIFLAEGRLEEARALYERALAQYRRLEEPWGISITLTGLGGVAMRAGDYATARSRFEEALALRRPMRQAWDIEIALTSLGEAERRAGNDAHAQEILEESLALNHDVGDKEHLAWTLHNLGVVAIHRGDAAAARAALTAALALRAEQGNPVKIPQAIAAVARVAVMDGDAARAARLWGAAAGIRAAHALSDASNDEADEEERTFGLIRAALAPAAFAAAVEAGRGLSLPETLVLAGCNVPGSLPVDTLSR